MAVYLPIISEFNAKGIARAKREFRSLEGFGAKTGYALKKAFVPATAAIAALAAASMKAVDAALEDQKSQAELARIMRRTIGATQGQINANEEWISTQGRLFGITDDDLRPALAKVLRVTKDLQKSWKVVALGQDIARATGKDLASVTDALTKALGGNMKPLRSLAPELAGLIKNGAKVDEVFGKLGETFGGAASEYANTAAGRMEILKLRFSELFEELGYALLPAFEKLMPYFEDLAKWLEDNPDAVANFARNAADLVKTFIDLLGAIKAIPEAFGRMVDYVIDKMEWLVNSTIALLNITIRAMNKIPFVNISEIDYVDFNAKPNAPQNTPFGNMVQNRRTQSSEAAARRMLPPGIQGPVLSNAPANVTVNVNGGDPRAVVDAIVKWSRQNGRLPAQVQTAY